MGVKFLSDEWAAAVQDALNGNDSFKSAIGGNAAKLQQVVTGGPDGDAKYWFKLEGGAAALGIGDIDGPDATITQDYESAVALAKGELTGMAAYMGGKIQVQGDLMKLMMLQGVIGQLPAAMAAVDVDY